MADDMRIVCANVHNDTGEIEIIVEREIGDLISETVISTFWITKEEIFDKGCKFVKYK